MFNPKENVLDRIEQTFIIFKSNFIPLFLPFFLYKLISVVLFGTVLWWYILHNLSNVSFDSISTFSFLNNPFIIIIIICVTLFFIFYLLLYIPILISLIKSIKQSTLNQEINMLENLNFWFSRLVKSFNTYWNIFAYIALFPAIIFIIWWIFFNLSFYFINLIFLKSIWLFLMVVAFVLFIFYSIYRWYKTTFSMISAVNYDEFDKNNFINSVKVTDNNWWRIIWNLILLWLILSLTSWIINSLIFVFIPTNSFDLTFFLNLKNSLSDWGKNLNELINTISSSYSLIGSLISWFINNIITTILTIFTTIFVFVFFNRLEFEYKNLSTKSTVDNSPKNIDVNDIVNNLEL